MGESLVDQCVQAVEEVTGLKYSDMLEEQAKGRVQRPIDSRTLSASLDREKRKLDRARARAKQKVEKGPKESMSKVTKQDVNADRVIQALQKDPDLLGAVKAALHLVPVVHPWVGPKGDVGTDLYIRKDVMGRDVASVWKSKVTQRNYDGDLEQVVRWKWEVSLPERNAEMGFTHFKKEGDNEFLDMAMLHADQMLVTLAPNVVFLHPDDDIGVRMASEGFKEPSLA